MKSLKKLNFLVLFHHVGVVNICLKERYDTKTETKHKSTEARILEDVQIMLEWTTHSRNNNLNDICMTGQLNWCFFPI